MGTTLSRVSTFLPAVILFLGFSPALASAQDDDGNSSRDAQNARSDDDRPSNTDNSNDDSASRRRQGNAHHKALGVVLNEDGAGNLYIQRVVRGSPAERAGLRRGDEILTVEGQRVNHPDEMRRALARSDDDTVKVGILRRGRHQTVTASVGDADEVFGRSNAMNPARMYGPNSGQYRGYGRNDNQGYTSNVRQGYGRNDDQDDADPDLGMNGSNRGGRGYRGDDQGSQRQNLHRGAALGIALDQGPRRGAWVTDVFPYSPAEEAGIRAGDEIVAIDGEDVESADAVIQAISQKQPGERIALDIDRNGREKSLQAQLVRHEDLVRRDDRDRSGRMEQSRRPNRNNNLDGGGANRNDNSGSGDQDR